MASIVYATTHQRNNRQPEAVWLNTVSLITEILSHQNCTVSIHNTIQAAKPNQSSKQLGMIRNKFNQA